MRKMSFYELDVDGDYIDVKFFKELERLLRPTSKSEDE